MKGIIAILSVLTALALPASAFASCEYWDGNVTTKIRQVPGPERLTFASSVITLDPTRPNGSQLGAITMSLSQITDADGVHMSNAEFDCTENFVNIAMEPIGAPVPGMSNVFQSAIPGLGYMMRLTSNFIPWWPALYPQGSTKANYVNPGVGMEIIFIKTGPIGGPGVLSGSVGRWRATGPDVVWFEVGPATPIIVKLAVPTCTVSTPDVAVALDSAGITDFPIVGSTVKEKDFNVALACSGGDPSSKIGMYMSLADATTPGNVTNTLSPASGQTAGGMGVQILRNGTPINFNPATNEFKVQDVLQGSTGTVNIPFKARYIRTGAVTAGQVQAIATFTMDYR